MKSAKPAMRCPKCGALNRSGARFCNQCGQPLRQVRPTAPSNRRSRPSSNFRLFLIGVAIATLVMLGMVGGGWLIYQKFTGTQATPFPIVQNTPAGATATVVVEAMATGTATSDVPTATPTETPASGYILFANGTPSSNGSPFEDNFVEGSWDIFVADTNGDNRELLMHTTADYSLGQFSPNGRWLWFQVCESGFVGEDYVRTCTLYVARSDGSDLHEIYASDTSIICKGISMDGWLLEFEDQTSDPNTYFLYNYKNDLLINWMDYSVGQISCNGRYALLRERGYGVLADIETGQLHKLFEFNQDGTPSFAFSSDEQNLIVQDYLNNPGYRIYNIASSTWSTLNFDGKSWLSILPDGKHMLLEEDSDESKLFILNKETEERSVYLSGYHGYSIDFAERCDIGYVYMRSMPYPTDKIMISAYKDEGQSDIYVANGDGSALQLIAQDAQTAMFLGDFEHVMLVRGLSDDWNSEISGILTIIDLRTEIEYPIPCFVLGPPALELSPDGNHVLCHEFTLGDHDINWDTYKSWVINLDTMELKQIEVEHPIGSVIRVSFSSDGNKIVYGTWDVLSHETYVVNLDGSNAVLIGEKTFPISFSVLD